MAERIVYKVKGLDCSEEVAVLKKELGHRKGVPWQHRGNRNADAFWQSHGRMITTGLSAACLLAGFLTHWYVHRDFLDVPPGGFGELNDPVGP